jgi:molecular chaperone GrpE
MARTNGKSEVDPQELDANHELPASEETEEIEVPAGIGGPGQAAAGVQKSEAETELQKLKAERDTLLDRLARLQAEFENARKRAAKEQQDFREYAVADAVKVLLPILDSFERALQSSASQAGEFRNGIELIYKQLQDALAKMGVTPIPAQGQPFDPHIHQAIEMVETNEAKDHHVLDELQRGYKLKDRLLRPSMVRVAKNSKR